MKLLVVTSVEYVHREVVLLASRILFLVSRLEKNGWPTDAMQLWVPQVEACTEPVRKTTGKG